MTLTVFNIGDIINMMRGFVNKIRSIYLFAQAGLVVGYISTVLLFAIFLTCLFSLILYILPNNLYISIISVSLGILLISVAFIYEIILYVKSFRQGEAWFLIERASNVSAGRIRGAYEVCLQALTGFSFSQSFALRAQERASSSLRVVFPVKEPFRKYHLILSLFVIAFVIFSIIYPSVLLSAYNKVVLVYENIFLSQTAVFTIEPGGVLIHRGDDVNVVLTLKKKTEYHPLVEVKKGLGNVEMTKMERVDDKRYTAKLKEITEGILYRGNVGRVASDWYEVKILKEPALVGLECRIKPPDYAGESSTIRKSIEGEIFCLPGSQLSMEANITGDVEGASVLVGKKASGLKRGEDGIFRGDITLDSSGPISLISRDKLGSEATLEKGIITITPDRAPYIKLISPTGKATVSTDLLLKLTYEAGDDFGISSVGVEYKNETAGAGGKFSIISGEGRKQLSGDVTFDLYRADPLPGDTVIVRLYVYDNDVISGPKIAYSEQVKVKVPDIVQFFKSAEKEGEYVDIEDVLKEGEKISDSLEEIAKNFKERGEIEYKSYKQMEDVIEKEKLLKGRAEDIVEKIGEMKKMGVEGFLSEETLYKLSKAQEMLQNLLDEQTKTLLEKMQEVLKDLPKEDVEKAMKEIMESQEELNRRLDTLMEFLKNAKIETMLDSLKEKLERMIEEQNDITKNTEKAKENDVEPLLEKQKGNKESYGEFTKDLEELMKEAESKGELSSELKDLKEKGFVGAPLKSMDEMMKALSEKNVSKATSSSASSANSMKDLYKMLEGLSSSYLEAQRQNIIEALMGIEKDLSQTYNSADVLESYAKSGDLEKTGEIAKELSSALNPIKEKMEDVMTQTLFLGSDALKNIENAQETLNGLLLENSRNKTIEGLSKAKSSLLTARMFIASALEGVRNASTPSGLSDFLSSLGQIISNQGQFGKSLMDYLQGKGGFDYSSLLQLAGMQKAIRESLEKLLERYQSLGESLEGLNGASEAMKKIEGMLSEGANADRIKEEQEHLMENLLRSEKAIKSKGISRERKSTPGKEYIDTSVPQLLPSGVEEKATVKTPPLDVPAQPTGLGERGLIEDYFRSLVE